MTSSLLAAAMLCSAHVAFAAPQCGPFPCRPNTGYPGNDIPGFGPPGLPNPNATAGYEGCALACYAVAACRAWTAIDAGVGDCTAPGGCCLLKSAGANFNSTTVTGHCSATLRPDRASFPPLPPPVSPPPTARNVLHIIIDDLRPQLEPYGQAYMHTPHLAGLAAGGTVFQHAYAAIAVCSPSRMSFLTGRLPPHTRTWNFMNNFRAAQCDDLPDLQYNDVTYASFAASPDWGGSSPCCDLCTADVKCAAWTYKAAEGTCHLKSGDTLPVKAVGAVSGRRGDLASRAWTSLPGLFLRNGYTTLGSGKIFHADNGAWGVAPWDGAGQPPLQDPPSWSDTPSNQGTMYDVNAVGCTWGCGPESPYGCAVDADIDGVPGPGVPPLADKVSTDDAVAKLTAAAAARVAGGPPFAIFAGIRKPHTPFRFPAPYAALYPPPANITLAKYKTFDASIPPIAYHPSGLWGEPYTAMPDADAQLARQGYYAAVSWMDHLVGRLLTALDASGLANDTVVAIHGDHGYSLGESSIWEKFTNFEQGVRVPLIVRAPWLGAGSVADLVELVDLYPTMAALAGVPLPPGEVFDGQSLVPLMSAAALHTAPPPEAVRGYALSVYPRCPKDTVNASMMWRANDCMEVERSAFFSMGVSLRTEDYRYTEWTLWDGNALAPRFDQPPIGVELYIHTDVDSNDFDSPAEVFNHADDPAYATVRAQLAAQLRVVYAARGA